MIDKNGLLLPLAILAGVVAGAVCGYFLPQFSLAIAFIGQLFLGALRLIVIPLLVAGAVTGVAAVGEMRRAGRAGGVMASYFLVTTLIGAAIAAGLAVLLAPAPTFRVISDASPLVPGWGSISEALGELIPGNLFQAVIEGKYLGLVLLALFLGGVLAVMGVRGRTVLSFFKGLQEGLLRVVRLVLYAAPIGLFSLVASAFASNPQGMAGWMGLSGTYATVALIALAIQGLVILPLIAWRAGFCSPWRLYGDLSSSFLTAAGTSSKVAAFPLTYQCLTEKSKIDGRAVSMALPLGMVINLDGTAITMVVGAVVSALAFGVPIGFFDILLVVVVALLLSLGAAGIPSASLLAAPVLFGVIGLTAEQAAVAVAAVAGVDWLVDRVRAMVNLGSDAVGATVVAQSFGLAKARRPGRVRPTGRPERSPAARAGGRAVPTGAGRSDQRRQRVDSRRGQERGSRDSAGGGRTSRPGQRGRGRPDGGDRSPFQMSPGRTPALDVEKGRPAKPDERPDRDRDDRREHRRPYEPAGSRGRRPAGRQRGAAEERQRTREDTGTARRPEQPTQGPTGLDNGQGRLSPSVAARELARVSAQLRKEESTIESEETFSPSPLAGVDSGGPTEPRDEIDRARETDLETAGLEEDSFGMSEPEEPGSGESTGDHEEEPTSAADVADTSSLAYGRRRHYAGAAFRRNGDAAAEQPPNEPVGDEPPQGFSGEEVAFGRVKRKRTR